MNEDDLRKYAEDKRRNITIHNKFKKLDPKKVGMDLMLPRCIPVLRGTNKSVYPGTEQGFASKSHTNDVYVELFNNQSFNPEYDENAILKIKNYYPPSLIFQQLPVKEKL